MIYLSGRRGQVQPEHGINSLGLRLRLPVLLATPAVHEPPLAIDVYEFHEISTSPSLCFSNPGHAITVGVCIGSRLLSQLCLDPSRSVVLSVA